MRDYDILIIGAGAAGMMCAAQAGGQGRRVLLVDSAASAGEKIRISGGGRCNFTNLYSGPENFVSENPHFCKSALAGYTPQDFIKLVEDYGIDWHEKHKGQLFCQGSATQIIEMLRCECQKSGVRFALQSQIINIRKQGGHFIVTTDKTSYRCPHLVIATGGPSIPKMGASGFGYKIAHQFGLRVIEPVPALVPFVFTDAARETLKSLSGIGLEAEIACGKTSFRDDLLFTHRGLSGPAVLQISTYWRPGQEIAVNLCPRRNLAQDIAQTRGVMPRQKTLSFLCQSLPKKLVSSLLSSLAAELGTLNVADLRKEDIELLCQKFQDWRLKPAGTEGFRTAEVTRGGVDTAELSSKTFAARKVEGLYFIGEVVDVTGHLGGHNFQWAWASGTACGRALARLSS